MRVIGGEFRSRILKSIPGQDVRPTPDRLRETLFNILAPRIDGTIFADLYAGTGSVGIEALSRGAASAIFIDQSRTAVNVIRENLHSLRLEQRSTVRHGRAVALLPQINADLFFVDPPYKLESEYERVLTILGERKAAPVPVLVVAQHDIRLTLAETYGSLHRARAVKQGDNSLTFYEPDQ
jgi:16S rRNA (guanine966-N2)-methyltransferase